MQRKNSKKLDKKHRYWSITMSEYFDKGKQRMQDKFKKFKIDWGF